MSLVQNFLSSKTFAVAGASNDRTKFGNRVFLTLLAHGKEVHPLHPKEEFVEGHKAYPTVHDLESVPEALSIVTPPHVTATVIDQAIAAGVKRIWMQPGAEHPEACERARTAGLEVIDDGSCLLIEIRSFSN